MVWYTDGPTKRTSSATSTTRRWKPWPDFFEQVALRPVFRGLGIQRRDQLLGCWRRGDCSRQNNIPRRNLPAVHTAVVAIVRTDCGAFEGDSGKQAARPRTAQDFGLQSRVG